MVKSYVETSKGLKDLKSIFTSEYKDLTSDQDLYEVCVLGALLTKGAVGDIKSEYKSLAQKYYESVAKVEAGTETKKNDVNGTYTSGAAEIQDKTKTDIETKTKIEAGKNITEASITVSAGADLRKMDETKAKTLYDEKIKAL